MNSDNFPNTPHLDEQLLTGVRMFGLPWLEAKVIQIKNEFVGGTDTLPVIESPWGDADDIGAMTHADLDALRAQYPQYAAAMPSRVICLRGQPLDDLSERQLAQRTANLEARHSLRVLGANWDKNNDGVLDTLEEHVSRTPVSARFPKQYPITQAMWWEKPETAPATFLGEVRVFPHAVVCEDVEDVIATAREWITGQRTGYTT